MGKRKNNSSNAAHVLESSVAPILELNFTDPLFTTAAHPTKPLLISGFATGHLYCNSYNGEKLEELEQVNREKAIERQQKAYEAGTITHVNKSVSQLKSKWWTTFNDIKDVPSKGEELVNVQTNWKTKRHKGSCRHAIFDPRADCLGDYLYTCGTDNIIKKAATETGKVVGKVDVVADYSSAKDKLTKLCHSTTHPFLLSGTEDGHVLVYDSSNLGGTNKIKFKVELAHDDSINHILSMPAVSSYHYLTLGSTTLSHIDIRKGIITQSDDQEDELLAMSYTTDELSENKNDTVLVSHGEGIITIWKNSKNKLADQLTRIKVNKTASIDAIVPTMNNDYENGMASSVWCGDSEGLLHRVNYKRGRVVETRLHSVARGKSGAVDEVGVLDIDYDYRLISAGMDSLKIWSNRYSDDQEEEEEEEEGEDSVGGTDSGSDEESFSDISSVDFDSENDDDDEESLDKEQWEDVEDEDIPVGTDGNTRNEANKDNTKSEYVLPFKRKRRDFSEVITKPKKKLIDINKLTKPSSKEDDGDDDNKSLQEQEKAEEVPQFKKQKLKEKKVTAKQLRNMQKHEHGIRKFEGL